MELDGNASRFRDNMVAQFAGEAKQPGMLPPAEDMLIDMEEPVEKFNFSDEEDAFPSFSDFACLSSPSASAASTFPKQSTSTSSSSSSFSSPSPWSFLLVPNDADGAHQPPASEGPLVPTADADFDILGQEIDLWENYTEQPIESAWDSSLSFFPGESGGGGGGDDLQTANEEKVGFLCGGEDCSTEDLADVFLDWLKRNRDSISPEDLRSVKLKRSTIESAALRLGGGKQGRVQLLKLILSWVQNHHLQKRRRRGRGSEASGRDQELPNYPPPPSQIATTSNPNIDFYYDAVPCNSWMPHKGESFNPPAIPGYRDDAAAAAVAVPPYHHYKDQAFSSHSWPQGFSPAVVQYSQMPAPAPELPQHQPHLPVYYTGQMASATREARKKRMARHRKSSSFPHHKSQQQQNLDALVGTEESFSDHSNVHKDSSTKSSFLPSLPAEIFSSSSSAAAAAAAVAPSFPAMAQLQEENCLHRRTASPGERRREGIKSENNYKFLLRKVLKQSDVGSLGRIVLPKREAEIHLPALDTRDGISIEMEDIGASRIWNMRYRFWPNNKSRMYLLENTGEFVRSNGLQEGDFIVLYSDVKSGKYMIRGVKVRQSVDMMKGAINYRSAGKPHQKKEIKSKSPFAEEC